MAGMASPRSPTRKTMPESAGPGDSVTRTILPEWSPTPSRLIAFRMVCCLMTGSDKEQQGCHRRHEAQMAEFIGPNSAASRSAAGPCGANDTALNRLRLVFETLDVDDDLDLVVALACLNGDAVKRRGLHHGAQAMARGVERLTVQTAVDHGVGARADLDAAHDERLDLVHVQALVDPGHEQHLRAVGLRADLARLARRDRRGIGDEREHAERGLRERLRARRAPGADPDIRLHLELLVAGTDHCIGGPLRLPPTPLIHAVDLHRSVGNPLRLPPTPLIHAVDLHGSDANPLRL